MFGQATTVILFLLSISCVCGRVWDAGLPTSYVPIRRTANQYNQVEVSKIVAKIIRTSSGQRGGVWYGVLQERQFTDEVGVMQRTAGL